MTLMLKLDLDITMMYYYVKNEVSISIYSKVIAQTDRQMHTHYENLTSTACAGGKYCVNWWIPCFTFNIERFVQQLVIFLLFVMNDISHLYTCIFDIETVCYK